MKVQIHIPFPVYLQGENKDSLNPEITFRHNGIAAHVSLEGSDVMTLTTGEHSEPHFRTISGYALDLELPAKVESEFTQLITNRQYEEVVAKLLPIVNRVNRGLRNYGWVTALKEVTKPSRPEVLLRQWQARFTTDGTKWEKVVQPPTGKGLFERLAFEYAADDNKRSLSIERWEQIAEAVQQDYPARPEDEFITNALEQFHDNNLRSAVVEAVACVEIVLTQFLKAYCRVRKGFSEEKLTRVTKGAGFPSRVGLLLELILTQKEREDLDLDAVLLTYNWRNDIVHSTGHFPKGVSEAQIRDGIFQCLQLISRLSRKRDEIVVEPEAKLLAHEIAQVFPVPVPTIRFFGRLHVVVVTFDYPSESLLATVLRGSAASSWKKDQPLFETVRAYLESLLAKRDRLFRVDAHLTITFKSGPTYFARFEDGRWVKTYIENAAAVNTPDKA